MATSTFSFVSQSGKHGRFPALDEAVRDMVTSTLIQGRFRVEMPVVMASGSSATVSVWPEGNGDTFMVSDDGCALFEITAGAFSEQIFRRVAVERCERYGAHFDGGSMLYLRVSAGRLRGAIVAMANLIKEVVDLTLERSLEHKVRQIDADLWDKLERTFGPQSVEKKAIILGESTAQHEFSAVVQTQSGVVAFDTFSAHGSSINSAYVKMADVGRMDFPPRRIAVTKRLSDIGPKLNLLTSVSQVIEISIENRVLQQLADAA